jgi:hypothetical protein
MDMDPDVYKRIANMEGEIKFMSKVLERLDDVLPIIAKSQVCLDNVLKRQETCPIAAHDNRIQSLEHFSNLYKGLWIAVFGFIGYLEKQAIWHAIQKVFT